MTVSKTLDVTHAQSSSSPKSRSIAYLASQYPMLSMIFILREVIQLRELGFRIDVASINSPDRAPERLTTVEATEAENAYFIKRHGLRGAAKAHFQTLFTNLGGYLRGLRLVLRLAGLDLRRLVLNLVYFSEALMVGVDEAQEATAPSRPPGIAGSYSGFVRASDIRIRFIYDGPRAR